MKETETFAKLMRDFPRRVTRVHPVLAVKFDQYCFRHNLNKETAIAAMMYYLVAKGLNAVDFESLMLKLHDIYSGVMTEIESAPDTRPVSRNELSLLAMRIQRMLEPSGEVADLKAAAESAEPGLRESPRRKRRGHG